MVRATVCPCSRPDLPLERQIREGYDPLQDRAVAIGRELAELRRVLITTLS